jgi:SNF2 family DNA or RNA helicase
MVIMRQAVDDFLNRKLRDSSTVKLFSRRELEKRIAALEPKPDWVKEPYTHQLACFLFGVKYPGYLFFLGMGGGKTKLTLDLFRWRRARGEAKRALVLVPYSVNVDAWGEEIEKHAPDLRMGLANKQAQCRAQMAVDTDNDIVVITYMGWLHLVGGKADTQKRGSRKKMEIDDKKARAFEAGFDFVIFDESDAVANRKSLTFAFCHRLFLSSKFRYCLTGTPIDKNPEDLWAQFRVADGGETLGATVGLFHAAFFKQVLNHWTGFPEYVFDRKKTKILNQASRNRSIRYSDEEMVDLPPLVESKIPINLEDEQLDKHKVLIGEIRAAHKNYQLTENVYIRMRQLSSGYSVVKGPSGEKIIVEMKSNPKMEGLIELIKQIPGGDKILVANIYKATGALIESRLKKEKIKSVRIYSGTKDKTGVIRQFKEDEKTRILLCSQSASYGLNLQIANVIVFFETPDRGRIRAQWVKRIHRTGQEKHCRVYDLIARGSVDEKVIRSLEEGKCLFDELIDKGDYNAV